MVAGGGTDPLRLLRYASKSAKSDERNSLSNPPGISDCGSERRVSMSAVSMRIVWLVEFRNKKRALAL